MSNRTVMSVLGLLVAPALTVGLAFATPASNIPGAPVPTPEAQQKAVQRGITFLENDAVKWRAERGCATCHHGMLTIWALTEAKAQGYPINEPLLVDFTDWAKAKIIPPMDAPRETRPGWRLVSQGATYLGVASYNLPLLSRDEVRRLAVHLAQRQEADGGYELPPHANAPPPVFFESRESVALFAMLAWEPLVGVDPKLMAANKAARDKTLAFLNKVPTSGSTQVLALRYLLDVRSGKSEGERAPRLNQLFQRQNPDGGWGQEKGLGSDAYATGQTLYALSFAGLNADRPEIRRAIAFLVSTQREDGSWRVTPRNYPEVDWKRTGIAMNYFGSAWAELALARLIPSPPDTPKKQRDAFDTIKGFHGKYTVDGMLSDKPVTEVDYRYYEFENHHLAEMVKPLAAFPRLHTLQLKSTKATDAALVALQGLTNLRHLVIEDAPLTDAAIPHLKALR